MGSGDGYSWIDLGQIILYCIYISPNIDPSTFRDRLTTLSNDLKTRPKPFVIIGDFNSRSRVWGSKTEDNKGEAVLDWAASHNMTIHNDGMRPTFSRGESESYLDLTMSSGDFASKITHWRVLDHLESMSDHNYITFDMELSNLSTPTARSTRFRKISSKDKLRLDNFNWPDADKWRNEADITKAARSFCNCYLRKRNKSSRAEVPWWSMEIRDLRIETMRAKRLSSRARNNSRASTDQKAEAHSSYKLKRKILRQAIKAAKRALYDELLTDLDRDPWGKAYKMLTNAKSESPALDDDEAVRIARELFPTHDHVTWEKEEAQGPLFTLEELKEVTERIPNGKAAGPDEIPPEVTRALLDKHPQEALCIFNKLLGKQEFPAIWKTADLLLIPKPNSTKFRPICLLSTMSKVLERLIANRLKSHITLSPMQFGFREGKSTIDAISAVIAAARKGKTGKAAVALITIDIRNAFNAASWTGIIEALKRKQTPEYLINFTKSYLSDRSIKIGNSRIDITAGVPQGSVLGPLLWNALYDEILQVKYKNTEAVCFADDLALVVRGHDKFELERSANHAIERVTQKLRMMKLQIAPEKTEAVLLVSKKGCKELTLDVQGQKIATKDHLKYLGVWLSKDLSMKYHIEEAAAKGVRGAMALSKLMPQQSGPAHKSRKVLATAAIAAVTYAAPVWAHVLEAKKYRDLLRRKSKCLLCRVSQCNMRVSAVAAEVLSSIIPIHLQALQSLRRHHGEEKSMGSQVTLDKWQEEWTKADGVASWTKRLIPDVRKWYQRKHGWMSYHLSQLLSGHGSAREGLYRCGFVRSPLCLFCREVDTTEHAFFKCKMFNGERSYLDQRWGPVTPDNVVEKMLSDIQCWNDIEEYAKAVVTSKDKWSASVV